MEISRAGAALGLRPEARGANCGRVAELDEADLLARAGAAAQRYRPGAAIRGLRRMHGGVSSLTLAAGVELPGAPPQQIVLKVAPPGLPPVRNRDVLRQARILRSLGAVGAVVPEVLFEDAGAPPFFAMRHVRGDAYEPRLDVVEDPPDPAVVDARARAAARTLAELQSTELAALGVADEPAVPLAAELDRWARLLSTVDPGICPGHAQLHEKLAAGIPARCAHPTLVHGDYRLANMLFVGPELAAVIDWEIWSVGDPRIDLAWLLMHTDPAHAFAASRGRANSEAAAGMPAADELLAEYRAVRDVEVADLEWFLAHSFYKTASTIAALVKRNRKAAHPDPSLEVAARTLPELVERGQEVLARSGQSK